MKHTFKVLGTVGLMAVLVFSFAACDNLSELLEEAKVLTGTVTITGTAEVGNTLTANTAGLSGSGAISYQWKRGTTGIGTDSSTYVVESGDTGASITVTVTRSGYRGSVTSAAIAVGGGTGTIAPPGGAPSSALAGTIWKAPATTVVGEKGETITIYPATLIFTSASKWARLTEGRSASGETWISIDDGIYMVNGSTVVLIAYVYGQPHQEMSGVMTGNTFVIGDVRFTQQLGMGNISLTGTTWKAVYDDERKSEGGSEIPIKHTSILMFTTASTFTMDSKYMSSPGKEESYSGRGTYTVYGNDVVLDIDGAGIYMGRVNGNTFVLYNNGPPSTTYTKQ